MTPIDEQNLKSELLRLVLVVRQAKLKKDVKDKAIDDIVHILDDICTWIEKAKTEVTIYQDVFIKAGKIIKFLEE